MTCDRRQRRGLVLGLLLGLLSAAAECAQAPATQQADLATIAVAPQETGLPLLRSFSPKEYGAQGQNWAIAQDRRGVIYVGNNDGVLEFDGSRWRLIRIPNQTGGRSLAVDTQGRVYVGAVGEIGYLEADASGQTRYVSLLDQVPPEARNFADVWQTFVTPEGVVFSSFQRLMRLQGEHFESWTPETTFHVPLLVSGRLFVREVGRGLLELIDGELRLVSGSERFADEKIRGMFALAEPGKNLDATASILLATQAQGLFLLHADGVTPWATSIDAELKRDLVYTGARLPDGSLALGTLQGGLYLLDVQGRLQGHLGKANGLPDQVVYALFVDRERSLWLGTANGVARVEVGGPLSRFDERKGLTGAVHAVHRHQGELYASTQQGLYRLRPGLGTQFERIAGIDGQTWGFLSLGDELLVGNYQGVYVVAGGGATLVQPFDQAYCLLASTVQPDRVFVGLRAGISSLRRVDGRWRSEGKVPGISDEIGTLLEDREGRLWLGTYNTGVLRLRFAETRPDGNLQAPQVERYGVTEGLPYSNHNWVYPIAGEPLLATWAGIYRFIEDRRRFEPDPRFVGLFAPPRAMSSLREDPDRGVWLFAADPVTGLEEAGLASRGADGRYRWQSRALRALVGTGTSDVQRIWRDADGVVWFGASDGLFRFDARIPKRYDLPFQALVRQVSNRDGRILYGGSAAIAAPAIEHADNALRFNYAAPSFDGLDALRFQVRLDGNDRDWSDWRSENYQDYNNLFEGTYRFRVRANNLYGVVSDEAVFSFSVLPPWYRTSWAYLGYLLALGGSGWGALRWRLRRLQRQKAVLEATVAERTRQIATLGEVGRAITAQLDLDAALDTLYVQLNLMLDASVFGIGLYHAERSEIEFRLAIENGQRYQPYVRRMDDKNQLAVRCIEHSQTILIGDYPSEHGRYIAISDQRGQPLADGSISESPLSALYVPLQLKGAVIGVLCVQSFKPHAYTANDLELLQTLAAYAATAIDNARAHAALQASNTRLIETQQQLVLSEKMAALGTLTAGVAHEINNPTNFADVSAQNLRDELERLHQFLIDLAGGEDAPAEVLNAFAQRFAKLAEMNEVTLEGHRRIKAIVNDLRAFTRLDESEHKPVPIAEPIQSTVNLIRTKFDHVRFELDLAFNRTIECQPAKLGQVFMNLIVNACEAIEHCQDGRAGRVRIATSTQRNAEETMLAISVEDNGCGMDTATKAKVFEPFFTTKPVGAGTGMGMAIAFGIIKEHGGRIEVESTLGKGSRFVVMLPM